MYAVCPDGLANNEEGGNPVPVTVPIHSQRSDMNAKAFLARVLPFVAIATLAGPACAEDPATLGVALTGGLSGIGVDVGGNINSYLGVRGTFADISISHNGSYSTSTTWNATLKLEQTGLLLDYFPFQGGFHLTGGVVKDGNKVTLSAQPVAGSTATYKFNGNQYPTSDVSSANASVDWGKTVPYLGIGFGNLAGSKGFHFTTDFGVLFSGKPNAAINVNCSPAGATAGVCGALAGDVATDQAKLQNDVNKISIWPVVRVGIGWAF